jgi:hypothetical protein
MLALAVPGKHSGANFGHGESPMTNKGNCMRVLAFMTAICVTTLCAPAGAQVPKPQLTQAPCASAHNCPNYKRGAALEPPGTSAAQKVPCPAGTVYNPKRGTCKVLGSP